MIFVAFIDISMKSKLSKKIPEKSSYASTNIRDQLDLNPVAQTLLNHSNDTHQWRLHQGMGPLINPPRLTWLTPAEATAPSSCSWWADKPATQISRSVKADCKHAGCFFSLHALVFAGKWGLLAMSAFSFVFHSFQKTIQQKHHWKHVELSARLETNLQTNKQTLTDQIQKTWTLINAINGKWKMWSCGYSSSYV